MGRKKKASGGFLKLILLGVVFALFAKFVIIDGGYTSSFSENLVNEYEGNNQIDETIDVHDGWPIDNSLEFIILVVLGV